MENETSRIFEPLPLLSHPSPHQILPCEIRPTAHGSAWLVVVDRQGTSTHITTQATVVLIRVACLIASPNPKIRIRCNSSVPVSKAEETQTKNLRFNLTKPGPTNQTVSVEVDEISPFFFPVCRRSDAAGKTPAKHKHTNLRPRAHRTPKRVHESVFRQTRRRGIAEMVLVANRRPTMC